MNISSLFAATIPELRGKTWDQLLALWGNCAGFSRNKIYFHIIILLCGCSLIFNTVLYFTESVMAAVTVGVLLGLTIPPNIYFFVLFNKRRQEIRQYIMDHWNDFQQV
jgi:hypothetical protein